MQLRAVVSNCCDYIGCTQAQVTEQSYCDRRAWLGEGGSGAEGLCCWLGFPCPYGVLWVMMWGHNGWAEVALDAMGNSRSLLLSFFVCFCFSVPCEY